MGLVEIAGRAHALWPELELVVVFGSWARGQAARGSDVDIGLRTSAATRARRERVRLEVANAIEREMKRTVDLVDLDEAPVQLRFEIAREGRLIFERRRHAWADFCARAMVEWYEWSPLARRMHAAAVQRLGAKLTDGAR